MSYQHQSNYYDIDQILAEEERIVSCFETDGYNLGHLDQSSMHQDMKQGTSLELPFWLAKVLNNNDIISNSPPVIYLEDFKNKLMADAKVISMRKFPYYDRYGSMIVAFFKDDSLARVLAKVFKQRLFNIFTQSMHLKNTDISRLQSNLTSRENHVFELGYQASADYDSWKDRRGDKIVTSDRKYTATTTNNRRDETMLKKRKRITDNDDE
ncbi:hypothetical protein SAMD00019534_051980 [Acytostelium subglobosum LB1]|uniref:hypothetical protein n=1 Tax=Acytostelium subglobosum LB1 TaxID=1410327 RepID=UPI000644A725|nr:hypothetical protein SAMD00019534_051980 [Acytostelium subglobosum LB1]GAM22023.1 hypothetical protein SAMD00019534_051980 [Acytostelium subglobosum LB1]|eukprot:XP_012755123.1 hypothetical protein SAMD00019534_051980 [Acytostelium subglobosum LB1]